ncbi:MAG: hypothetical protein HC915_16710, partial [Anaerolineae bacterium]|nr:hypothetical protein [Anaerolineae bacterium]
MQDQLRQAIELAQRGERSAARALLLEVVAQQPDLEAAWLWLASVAADRRERV